MKYDIAKVTIIVPAKNEGEGLRKIIASLKQYAKEIIIVDGHSDDNTKQITLSSKVKYLLDGGIGRGEGVRLGLKKASGDVIVLFDADGSIPAINIPDLVLPIIGNAADLVIGSRRTGGSFDASITVDGMLRSFGSDFLVYLVNKKFSTNLTDILFSFRALRKSMVKNLKLKSNGFEIEQETVINALKTSYKVKEVPVRESARKWGQSKLRTISGIKLLFFLLKQLYF